MQKGGIRRYKKYSESKIFCRNSREEKEKNSKKDTCIYQWKRCNENSTVIKVKIVPGNTDMNE